MQQNILEKLASLPPEKRKLLEKMLQEEQIDLGEMVIMPQTQNRSVFPLSFAQERLWFLNQLEPENPAYNIPLAVKVNGRLHLPILKQTIAEIVRRHALLRTTFTTVDDQPVQVIAPEIDLPLTVMDLRGLPETAVNEQIARESQRIFNLAQGPLFHITLLQRSEEEQIIIFTMHHIISDGWSMNILVQEIGLLYQSFLAERPSPLPDLPIQYADFALWQREWQQEHDLAKQLTYWQDQLAGIPPLLELPTDRPRPAVQTNHGARSTFQLPPRLSQALQNLGQAEESTLFMTLLTAFQTLLYRYSGQADICVGTPIANRSRSDIENLIGFFVNTLVLRGRFTPELTFRELLAHTRETTINAFANQDLPFEMLVDALNIERNLSHTPIFQVMFSLGNTPMTELALPGLKLTPIETDTHTATFALTLDMVETPDGLHGSIEYNTDLFQEATIQRLIGHFQTLLEGIAADPDTAVSQLPLLTPAEIQQIAAWNDTAVPRPEASCVHHLIARQSSQTPDAAAIINGSEIWTYRQLNQQANQIAHHLLGHGIQPDDLVGVIIDRSPQMIAALLGILKAGAAYLPLDPHYPAERLAYMIQDARPKIIVHSGDFVSLTNGFQTIDLADWEEIAPESVENPITAVTQDNLAYVIYTSGSTGQPKGVMIPHRGLLNHNLAVIDLFGLTSADRVWQFATINFDTAVEEIFPTLIRGASLILRDAEIPPPADLCQIIRQQQLTVLDLPTAYWHAWAHELVQSQSRLPECLRLVIVGGDKVENEGLRLWLEAAQDTAVTWLNTYGPTETTVIATAYKAEGAAPDNVPIGRPIANTQTYVLDARQQPVPVGVPGELYIGGHNLARGYLNRPQLTAEKFISLPIANRQSPMTAYRTGDLVRYRPDGSLEFLGRADNQVKIRGFRVELGEIEAALIQHPQVQEAVVTVWRDPDDLGPKQLVAYFTAVGAQKPSTTELRHYLAESLPDYMIPAAFIFMAEMPLTSSGKIDRRHLPDPENLRPDLAAAYVPPRTPLEELLTNIWQELLGLERVGIHDNFFELGGHSLLATQLVSRLRHLFPAHLSLRALFEAPTIAGLAEQLTITQQAANGHTVPRIQPAPPEVERPLSYAQQRMWFLHQLEPDSPEYNMPDVVRLHGRLDIPALGKSLHTLIRRHETLRTAFITEDGRPKLSIADDLVLSIPVIDLRHLPPEEREAAAWHQAKEEALRPFDLTHPPLLRLTLLRLEDEAYLALLTMHHIIADGWSMNIFIQELVAGYTAVSQNKPVSLPELPIQYGDFAYWQRQWLQGDLLENQLNYWRGKLADAPALLNLPTDHPRPALQTHHGAHHNFTIPGKVSQSLQQISRQHDATLFMTLLAAFQILLSRYARQDDICVGTPIANRNRSEIEDLIGFFVNTLVLRTNLSGHPNFLQLLQQVRETTLEAYAHQDVPFDKVVDALQPERNMSHTPLFQVMFTWQNAPQTAVSLPGLHLESLPVENNIANFDLTLVLEETADGLAGGFEYNTDLFEAGTIERMSQHFQTLLAAIAADPEQTITALPLLTKAEQQQILAWNETAVSLPDQPIHHLIAQKAAETPNAIAVTQGPAQYTYRELEHRANQLAHYLQENGVGPNKLVGVALGRSPELIVALLGILKAGGAYLPLDPDYPPERLAFMIEDAQPGLILTDDSRLLDSSGSRVINFPTIRLKDYPTTRPQDHPTTRLPDSLAYVIYTSGSTGQPKGVMISHRGVLNHNLAVQKLFELRPSDRVWQFATINFDTAVEEIFPTLLSGATLVLRQPELPAVTELGQIIRQEGLTVLDLPTAYWHEWVHELAQSGTAVPDCLRLVVVGGDKANAAELRLWQELTAESAVTWLNTYGPTETTVIAAAYRPDGDPGDNVPIGKPLPNTQAFILDKQNQLAPIGVPGELVIAGHNLARGYLNRPELTAEKFIQLPISNYQSPITVYRTGDLCRYRPDGNIEFLGRVDHQVKIRGFRVELGEIETALAAHPAIRETAVTVQEKTPGSKRLAAYYTTVQDTAVTTTDLRQFLAEKLPGYMIPAFFIPLEQMPYTPSSKIDRRALPEPEQSRPDLAAEYVAPQSEKETILAEIWQSVLGLEQVGIHDNFFELGGDSILTIQVIARANQAGLHLAPRDFFAGPTIAQLAAAATAKPAIQAEQGLVQGPAPLTPIQQWFFAQELPHPHHWNQSLLLQARQPLQQELLETAVSHLFRHHDALRLRFTQNDHGWSQQHSDLAEPAAVAWFDFAHLPSTEQATAVSRETTRIQASFNLAEGPILQMAYFNLGSEEGGRLFVAAHHLAVDGISWRILLEDLQTAYTQLAQRTAVQLPPKTTSYKTWAQRLQEYAQSPAAQKELDVWLALGKTLPQPLPRDLPAGRNLEADVQTVTITLPKAETEALLRDVPPVYHTEINDVLLTALARTMQNWTGSPAVLIDLESHGRADLFADVDLSRTVGWFTAVYPVNLTPRPDPGAALKTIKEQLRRVPHLGIGYYLLRYLHPDKAIRQQMAALPQAEISFNYLGQFGQNLPEAAPFAPAPENPGPDRAPDNPRQYLLEIDGSIARGQLQLTWSYSQAIHHPHTIRQLAENYLADLRTLIAHCQAPEAGGITPSDVPLANLDQKNLDKLMAKLSKK